MSEHSDGMVSGAALETILRKYLIDHSSRKLNYLYWNVSDMKEMTLNFVNLSGKELNRINNSDLVYRVIKIKNTSDWAIITKFINKYVLKTEDTKTVYVIRVDFLLTYMKSIGYDVNKIELTQGAFKALYCNDSDESKRRPIAVIDTDIQSLYLLDRLYSKYKKMLFSEVPDASIENIIERYLKQQDFKFNITDLKITLPVSEALDVVSRKFINTLKASDQSCKLEQIYINSGASTVISRFTCSDICVVSVRVYLQVFLKKYEKKGK